MVPGIWWMFLNCGKIRTLLAVFSGENNGGWESQIVPEEGFRDTRDDGCVERRGEGE